MTANPRIRQLGPAPKRPALACVRTRAPRSGRRRPEILLGILLASLLFCGCSNSKIDSVYGRRRGMNGGSSVNGTAVLAGIFKNAGYRASSANRLSARLDRAQVLVWAPDAFTPPSLAEVTYLERWLSEEGGRTLIYIGRDYDASLGFWDEMLEAAPPTEMSEIRRRRAQAQSVFDNQRWRTPARYVGRWFSLERDAPRRRVRALQGPWSEGIDASRTEIEIKTRLRETEFADILERNVERTAQEASKAWNPPKSPATSKTKTASGAAPSQAAPSEPELYVEDTDDWQALDELDTKLGYRVDFDSLPSSKVLLQSGQDVLVRHMRIPSVMSEQDSQIFVVTNGSFLLNLPLVNKEHRKLAGRLVRACGAPGRVVFLESGPYELPISYYQNDADEPRDMWPLSYILAHLVALGLVYVFSAFPIFGRPRELDSESASDFGKHVEALGEMLERTGDVQYAKGRLAHYYELVRCESAATQLAASVEAVRNEETPVN